MTQNSRWYEAVMNLIVGQDPKGQPPGGGGWLTGLGRGEPQEVRAPVFQVWGGALDCGRGGQTVYRVCC